MRVPFTLAMIMVASFGVFAASFWTATRLDVQSAWSRFETLEQRGAYGRASGYGAHTLALMRRDGVSDETFDPRLRRVAAAHRLGGKPRRAAALYAEFLATPTGQRLAPTAGFEINRHLANLYLSTKTPVEAALIIADFVDLAGDNAADLMPADPNGLEAAYLAAADAAMPRFAELMPPSASRTTIEGADEHRLDNAAKLMSLGGYYARNADGGEAAAGLLATAYRTRLEILGAGHGDTAQAALLLGPVYTEIGRLKDAEDLYLATFHARERASGANNPRLSLYIRLLADNYRLQGRLTEAEALNQHMRALFRDSFGARRYAGDRERDRNAEVTRPVSIDFPLPADYVPKDLTAAASFEIPTSKLPTLAEMSIRTAMIDEETSMPKLLGALIASCATEGERLSLRSGYRSYGTQKQLYEGTNHRGKVAPPGTSEHQLGLAADIDVNGRLMRSTDRAYGCFNEQAWQYGFILTYPPNNDYLPADDPFEPWHWRFVGPRAALLYRETGPLGYPLEFLAAFDCYEERAIAGLFVGSDGEDVCLASVRPDLAQSVSVTPDTLQFQ